MEARGLGAVRNRTVAGAPKWHLRDLVFTASAAMVLAAAIYGALFPNTLSKIVSTCLKW
jgi:energy-coupling factor transporter transmembrane protein EcfT